MSVSVGNVTVRNASETTPSFSHTNDGLTVVLCINSNTNNTVSVIPTYNGVTMTLVQKITDGTRRAWMYYLDNAATGANTVAWTMSGGTNMRSQVISLLGTKASGSLGSIGSDVNGSSVSVTLPSTEVGSMVVAGLCKQTNEAITPGGGTTEVDDGQIVATDNRAWAGHETGGGSVTIDASWSTSGSAAFNVAEFIQGVVPRWMIYPRGRPRVPHMVSVLGEPA